MPPEPIRRLNVPFAELARVDSRELRGWRAVEHGNSLGRGDSSSVRARQDPKALARGENRHPWQVGAPVGDAVVGRCADAARADRTAAHPARLADAFEDGHRRSAPGDACAHGLTDCCKCRRKVGIAGVRVWRGPRDEGCLSGPHRAQSSYDLLVEQRFHDGPRRRQFHAWVEIVGEDVRAQMPDPQLSRAVAATSTMASRTPMAAVCSVRRTTRIWW